MFALPSELLELLGNWSHEGCVELEILAHEPLPIHVYWRIFFPLWGSRPISCTMVVFPGMRVHPFLESLLSQFFSHRCLCR